MGERGEGEIETWERGAGEGEKDGGEREESSETGTVATPRDGETETMNVRITLS